MTITLNKNNNNNNISCILAKPNQYLHVLSPQNSANNGHYHCHLPMETHPLITATLFAT